MMMATLTLMISRLTESKLLLHHLCLCLPHHLPAHLEVKHQIFSGQWYFDFLEKNSGDVGSPPSCPPTPPSPACSTPPPPPPIELQVTTLCQWSFWCRNSLLIPNRRLRRRASLRRRGCRPPRWWKRRTRTSTLTRWPAACPSNPSVTCHQTKHLVWEKSPLPFLSFTVLALVFLPVHQHWWPTHPTRSHCPPSHWKKSSFGVQAYFLICPHICPPAWEKSSSGGHHSGDRPTPWAAVQRRHWLLRHSEGENCQKVNCHLFWLAAIVSRGPKNGMIWRVGECNHGPAPAFCCLLYYVCQPSG